MSENGQIDLRLKVDGQRSLNNLENYRHYSNFFPLWFCKSWIARLYYDPKWNCCRRIYLQSPEHLMLTIIYLLATILDFWSVW